MGKHVKNRHLTPFPLPGDKSVFLYKCAGKTEQQKATDPKFHRFMSGSFGDGWKSINKPEELKFTVHHDMASDKGRRVACRPGCCMSITANQNQV